MIEVEIEDEAWAHVLPGVEELTRETAQAALDASSPDGLVEGVVTLLLTDDATVRDLNARFRGKDAPTNVLSFPAAESAAPHLGDIALAYGTCAREAVEQGKPLRAHLAHLVVHGVLHLVGYDHDADAQAEAMEEMEREILRRSGISDPYAPREAHAKS